MPNVGKFTKNPPSAFYGEKPVPSNKEQDWSLDGYNWNKE